MVHSIKKGCKNGKPLTDKFAITMHSAHAYSLLWQFLPRQNMSKLRWPCHHLWDNNFFLFFNMSRWSLKCKCLVFKEVYHNATGMLGIQKHLTCDFTFSQWWILIFQCVGKLFFLKHRWQKTKKQSFRGTPSTGRNSETEGSSCEEI
jgi:hypothetical protein